MAPDRAPVVPPYRRQSAWAWPTHVHLMLAGDGAAATAGHFSGSCLSWARSRFLERGVIAQRLGQRRLKIEKPLVERRRILAIEGDHFGASLATDDLEGILLDRFNDGGRDRTCRFPHKAQLRTSP